MLLNGMQFNMNCKLYIYTQHGMAITTWRSTAKSGVIQHNMAWQAQHGVASTTWRGKHNMGVQHIVCCNAL